MLSRLSHTLCLLLALCALAGCGYKLAGDGQPSVLPGADGGKVANLTIGRVQNPTLDPSLEHRLRSLLREELRSRGLAVWADEKKAQARLDLTIHSLLTRAAVKDERDRTLKSSVELHLSASLQPAGGGSAYWRSGPIATDWSYTGDESAAKDEVLRQAVRRLADHMTQAY